MTISVLNKLLMQNQSRKSLPDPGFDISCKPQKYLTIMMGVETMVPVPVHIFSYFTLRLFLTKEPRPY